MIEQTAPATTGVAKLGVLQVACGENPIEAICNCLQFPSSFQLRPSLGKVSAASSIAFRVLFRAPQASDVGSIPIARSRVILLQTFERNVAPFRRLAPVDLLRNDQFSVPACFLPRFCASLLSLL